MNSCSYYQAIVERSACWYVVAILKSFEHTAFDRTLHVKESRFEFFVPADMEPSFCAIMAYFQEQQLVFDLKKLPNRLTDLNQNVWHEDLLS